MRTRIEEYNTQVSENGMKLVSFLTLVVAGECTVLYNVKLTMEIELPRFHNLMNRNRKLSQEIMYEAIIQK